MIPRRDHAGVFRRPDLTGVSPATPGAGPNPPSPPGASSRAPTRGELASAGATVRQALREKLERGEPIDTPKETLQRRLEDLALVAGDLERAAAAVDRLTEAGSFAPELEAALAELWMRAEKIRPWIHSHVEPAACRCSEHKKETR